MLSRLRKGLIYTDLSEYVADHDEDYESELWNYDGKDVYRGTFDPQYVNQKLYVYSLYDEFSKRIGIAEHDSENPEVFSALWFYDTPFGTLLQDPSWASKNATFWSLLSNEAYQDCLEDNFKHVREWALNSGILLLTPADVLNKPPIYECSKCGKKSFHHGELITGNFSIIFIDEHFVMYSPPTAFQLHDAYEAPVAEEAHHSPRLEEFQESLQPEACS